MQNRKIVIHHNRDTHLRFTEVFYTIRPPTICSGRFVLERILLVYPVLVHSFLLWLPLPRGKVLGVQVPVCLTKRRSHTI